MQGVNDLNLAIMRQAFRGRTEVEEMIEGLRATVLATRTAER